ncbi:hypothetical protein ABKA04_001928 [Annulohypoxylon sp. FPYF3050]
MQGVDPPPTNRNPANRRGGQSFPARGRGAQPYRNSNNNRGSGRGGGQAQRNNHNHHNAPNPNANKRKRRNNNNNHNNNSNNNNNAPSGSSDQSSDPDIRLTTPPPLPFAGPLFPSATSSPFSSLHNNTNPHHSHIDGHGHGRGGGGGNRSRFCTECSAVRRANIRFRNWASHALRACNERFREWADDVGVGFESADEMDWQPEPVTRVLIVGSAAPILPPNPPPHPQFHVPNQNQNPNLNPNPGTNTKFGSAEAEQYLEFLKQNAGRGGDLLWPGPWPWPPYVDPNSNPNPTISAFSARVPSTGLPKLPTTLEDVPVPDVSSVHINSNTNPNLHTNVSNFNFNSSIGNPTPVSGFGMLGAGVTSCAGCAAEEREARLGTEQPPVPAWEPPQMPAVTSTCGPTRVGVPSTRPLGQNFAAYRGRSASRDSDGLY